MIALDYKIGGLVGRWEKMNSVFFQWHKILTGQASVMEHYKQRTIHEHAFVNTFWNKEKRLDLSPASIIFDGAQMFTKDFVWKRGHA